MTSPNIVKEPGNLDDSQDSNVCEINGIKFDHCSFDVSWNSSIKKCSILANKLNIEVHAGHGLDYKTTKILNKIKEIEEFNIGHFIIGESIFFGLSSVIKKFKRIIKG